MSNEQGIALATLQGREDAAWLPILAHEALGGGAIWNARQRGYGVYGDAAGGTADRQAKTRLIDGLVASGHARRVGRRTELTAEGSRLARSLCWDFEAATLTEAANRLNAATANDGYMIGRCGEKWIPETRIAGSLDPAALDVMQVLLLPLLRVRLIESAAMTRGRIFYRLTGGPIEQKHIEPLIDAADGKSRFSEELADVHWRQVLITREKIMHRYNGGEIGPIPLAPSPMRDAKDPDDIRGIVPLNDLASERVAVGAK